MNPDAPTVQVTIDNVRYAVPAGGTILRAAEAQGIWIPTLCAHAELSPYGGCRMCIVEVEGMRNLPTACTTPVAEGMVVRTDTAQVRAARTDILQLLMSEHTSSCLVCDEKEECKRYAVTVRKAGVTTGCRYCAKDGQCDFQAIAERLGVTGIDYPVHYRGMRVEDEDPFYDRDHNLCILCGRCARVCQEIRVADVLGFKNRGRSTVVGPAFDRTHLEAGCEFCGACVSVCPTGALAEKARKWEGKPDREETTTCPFCGVGCRMRLRIKGGKVIGTLPDDDPIVAGGQLCVRGRFCVSELVNDHHRVRRPLRRTGATLGEITWDHAVAHAAEVLAACPPGRYGMIVSPSLTDEDLYVAQKFARAAMGTHDVDNSARLFYGPAFDPYLDLLRRGATLADLRCAPVVLAVGLDTRFGRSVVGVELRRAVRHGRRLVTIHPREHNLTLIADRWLRPEPGGEPALLRRLVELTGGEGASGGEPPGASGREVVAGGETSGGERPSGRAVVTDDETAVVATMLREAEGPVILVGSELLGYDAAAEILAAVAALATNVGAHVLALPAQNNLVGSIRMGAYPDVLPGGWATTDDARRGALEKLWGVKLPAAPSGWNVFAPDRPDGVGVLHLVGETVPPTAVAGCETVLYQNTYPPGSGRLIELVLPSATFTEADGTTTSGEGRVQSVCKAVEPPPAALPDWEILCRIARKLGKSGFDFANVAQIREEMAKVAGLETCGAEREARALQCAARFGAGGEVRAKGAKGDDGAKDAKERTVRAEEPASSRGAATGAFVLSAAAIEHVHRGYPLAAWVEGAARLFPDGVVAVHPDDAAAAGIGEGDEVLVEFPGGRRIWRAAIRTEQTPGALHVTLRHGERLSPNPCRASARKNHV